MSAAKRGWLGEATEAGISRVRCITLRQIGEHLGLHLSRVCGIVKKAKGKT